MFDGTTTPDHHESRRRRSPGVGGLKQIPTVRGTLRPSRASIVITGGSLRLHVAARLVLLQCGRDEVSERNELAKNGNALSKSGPARNSSTPPASSFTRSRLACNCVADQIEHESAVVARIDAGPGRLQGTRVDRTFEPPQSAMSIGRSSFSRNFSELATHACCTVTPSRL